MDDKTKNPSDAVQNVSRLSADDLHWFNEGTHGHIYRQLGAHLTRHNESAGVTFSVWAPSAKQVFVMGDFNGWKKTQCPLSLVGTSGIWTGFFPNLGEGGQGNFGGVEAASVPWHNQSHMLTICLPPLGAVAFKPTSETKA